MIISIPWGNWYDNRKEDLYFPDNWDVTECSVASRPALNKDEIIYQLTHPIDSQGITAITKGKKSACIIIDDISRPTRGDQILEYIIELLGQGGIQEDKICILLALGGHRPMLKQDIIKKVGSKIYNRVAVINHNPFANDLAKLSDGKGLNVEINRHFAEADLRIAVGCIVPHSLAGFSGGAKAVIPGIGGIDTLYDNHSLAFSGANERSFSDNTLNPDNPLRKSMESMTGIARLDFIVNVVMNQDMEIAALFAGNYIGAHRAACKAAKDYYRTKLIENMDIIVLNAYPKDTEYSQIGTAFSVLGPYKERCVKPNGTIILTTAASEGGGYHVLFGPGMKLFSPHEGNIPPPVLRDREVIIYSPQLAKCDMKCFYTDEPPLLINTWADLIAKIKSRYPSPKVAVYTMGSMQIGYLDDK